MLPAESVYELSGDLSLEHLPGRRHVDARRVVEPNAFVLLRPTRGLASSRDSR